MQGNCNVICPKRTTASGGLTIEINSAQTCTWTQQNIWSIHVSPVTKPEKLCVWNYLPHFHPELTFDYNTFLLHSCCRLSYRRPLMWTATSWLSQTTCSYTTIPSMGEGLADSTLQKVRLLIWRMVGTFLHLIICYATFFPLILLVPSRHPAIFFLVQITHIVACSFLENLFFLHHFHLLF